MARWKLAAPCYLPIIDPQTDKQVVFEQRATSNTGRPATERWPCHLYLDPADPSQYNDEDPETGEKIVVIGTKAYRKDFILAKSIHPGQDWIPLDSEAAAISARVPAAVNPMSAEAFPANGPDLASAPRPDPALAEMRAMLAELTGQVTLLVGKNAELEAKLARAAEEDLPVEPLPSTSAKPSSLNLGV